MNNKLILPLVLSMALGKKKDLTKQESTRAGLMSFAGAAVGGDASTLLGTVSSVNAEANLKKSKESDRLLTQVAQDRAVLLDNITINDKKEILITSKPEVDALLRRFNKIPPATTPSTSSNGSSSTGDKPATPATPEDISQISKRLDDLSKRLQENNQTLNDSLNRLAQSLEKLTAGGTAGVATDTKAATAKA